MLEPPLRKAIELVAEKKCPNNNGAGIVCYSCEYNIMLYDLIDNICLLEMCKSYVKQHKNGSNLEKETNDSDR